VALLAPLVSLALASGALAHSGSRQRVGYAKLQRVCRTPRPRQVGCFALVRRPVPESSRAEAGVKPYVAGAGAYEVGPGGGFTPGDLESAYGFSGESGGAGQTVAIVDAYDDPKIEADLRTFDEHYGLPACTTEDKCFKKVNQAGKTSPLPAADTAGWSLEISLDVETVHSACPSCHILLVEADETYDNDLAEAVDSAVSLGATELSNSYGGSEQYIGSSEEKAYDHPGVAILASTGDNGYNSWDFINESKSKKSPYALVPNTPATLPTVVAVGGTKLTLNADGTRKSETVWNENGPADEYGLAGKRAEGASGGGCSTVFTAPLWQQRAAGFSAAECGTKRLDADVAAIADPYTGFSIYDSDNCGEYCERGGYGNGWIVVGGTSLASPFVASLYALAGGNQGVPYPALSLYGHLGEASALFDVTAGGNGYCGGETHSKCGEPDSLYGAVDCEGSTACNAATGFDGPTGVGAPKGLGAFKPLLPEAVISAPATAEEGSANTFHAAGSSDPYPEGSLETYTWHWGDGSFSDAATDETSHTFAAAGKYQVTLTVTDAYGVESTPVSSTVEVSESIQKKTEREAKKAKEEAEVEKLAQEALAAKEAEDKRLEEELAAKQRSEEAETAKHAQEFEAQQHRLELEQTARLAELKLPLAEVKLASTALAASVHGRLAVRLSCSALANASCTGTFAIHTLRKLRVSAGYKPAILLLAHGTFIIRGGAPSTVSVHVSHRVLGLLRRRHHVSVLVTLVTPDIAGGSFSSSARAVVRAARARASAANRASAAAAGEAQPAAQCLLLVGAAKTQCVQATTEPADGPGGSNAGLYVHYCPASAAASMVLARASNTSEAGWPPDQCLKMDKGGWGGLHTLVGKRGVHNWLLGGYGNDTIVGGNTGDVIWGDYHPSGGPPSQTATIYAGDGRNVIYADDTHDFVWTGTNPGTVVHAHGANTSGAIHCQSGGVIVFLSTTSERHFKLYGCRRISHYSVGY